MRVCIALGAFALLVVALHAAPSSEQEVVPEVDFVAEPKGKSEGKKEAHAPVSDKPEGKEAKPDGPVSDETQEIMKLKKATEQFRIENRIKQLLETDLEKAVAIIKQAPDEAHRLQETQAKMSMLGVETVYAADMSYCKYLKECDLDFKTDGKKAGCDKKTKDYHVFHKTLEKQVQLSAASAALSDHHKRAALLATNRVLDMHAEMKKLTNEKNSNIKHNKDRKKLFNSPKCKKAYDGVYTKADELQSKFLAMCTKMAKKADKAWRAFRKAQAEAEAKKEALKLRKYEIHLTPEEEHALPAAKAEKPHSVKTVAAKVVVDEKEEIPEAANNAKSDAAKGLKDILKSHDPAKAVKMAHESIMASQTAAHKEQEATDDEASGVTTLYQSEVELFDDVLV